jgi:hypothetical protein
VVASNISTTFCGLTRGDDDDDAAAAVAAANLDAASLLFAVAIVAARSFTPLDAVEVLVLNASAADLGDNTCYGGDDCASGDVVVTVIVDVGIFEVGVAAFVCNVLLAKVN